GYAGIFEKQLHIAFDDLVSGSHIISDSLGNNDGQSVLSKTTLQQTFREAYLGVGSAAVGRRGFMPFPLPGWKIRLSGLDEILPFGDLISCASLIHSYLGNYRLGYVHNIHHDILQPISLGSFMVLNKRPAYEPTTINIEKIFSPLIGLNITWYTNLRTSLQFDYTKLTSMALTNAAVLE